MFFVQVCESCDSVHIENSDISIRYFSLVIGVLLRIINTLFDIRTMISSGLGAPGVSDIVWGTVGSPSHSHWLWAWQSPGMEQTSLCSTHRQHFHSMFSLLLLNGKLQQYLLCRTGYPWDADVINLRAASQLYRYGVASCARSTQKRKSAFNEISKMERKKKQV